MSDPQAVIPPPGRPFHLEQYEPGYTDTDRDEGEKELERLRARLNDLQDMLYADRRFALLVVLQGIDTAGKDGTIKSVFRDVGPLGCGVANFGVPTAEELTHDYLWRYHRAAPERGRVVIFNRSHYEAVLVERVKNIVPKEVWSRRYDQINAWEAFLSAENTVVLKFFLHISKDEQRERLQERVDNPRKQWKFRPGDLEERKLWDDYQAAFADMVAMCNTAVAPWHVVPADHKWYRDVVVARALVAALEKLDLCYPPAVAGIAGTKVT